MTHLHRSWPRDRRTGCESTGTRNSTGKEADRRLLFSPNLYDPDRLWRVPVAIPEHRVPAAKSMRTDTLLLLDAYVLSRTPSNELPTRENSLAPSATTLISLTLFLLSSIAIAVFINHHLPERTPSAPSHVLLLHCRRRSHYPLHSPSLRKADAIECRRIRHQTTLSSWAHQTRLPLRAPMLPLWLPWHTHDDLPVL
ncbi:hypothetical protein C8F01DRAFT_1173844 [Mycena amicta]|nr:hypothetical protein C8F01DRAFT_1173844 [Mycena amicta]